MQTTPSAIVTAPDAPPWERQPGESPLWFGRFHTYLTLGQGRTIEAAFRAHQRDANECAGKPSRARRPPRVWYQASRRWHWEARAAAWDAQAQAAALESLTERVRKANEKHLALFQHGFIKGFQRLAKIDADQLTFEQALRLIQMSIEGERMVLGQPVTIAKHEHSGPAGGPIVSVQAVAAFTPPPEFVAAAVKVLIDHGAFEVVPQEGEPVEGDDAPAGDAQEAA